MRLASFLAAVSVAALLALAASAGASVDVDRAAPVAAPATASPIGLWQLGDRRYQWVPIDGGYEERMTEAVRLKNKCLVGIGAAITRFWWVEGNEYLMDERHWKKKWKKKQRKYVCVSYWVRSGSVTVDLSSDGNTLDVSCADDYGRLCWEYTRVGGTVSSCPAGGTRVFHDDFDSYALGLSRTSFGGVWSTGDTNVDVIGPGLWDLIPGNGAYIDMGGSGGNPVGHLTTGTQFQAGTYCLRVWVAGNHRNNDADTLEIQFGNDWRIVNRLRDDPFEVEEMVVTLTWPSSIELIAGGIGWNEADLLVGEVELLQLPSARPAR